MIARNATAMWCRLFVLFVAFGASNASAGELGAGQPRIDELGADEASGILAPGGRSVTEAPVGELPQQSPSIEHDGLPTNSAIAPEANSVMAARATLDQTKANAVLRLERLELRATRATKAGWGLLGSGAVLVVAGSSMMAVGESENNNVFSGGLLTASLGGLILGTGAGMAAANHPNQRLYRHVQSALRTQGETPDWNELSGALQALEKVGKRQQLRGAITLAASAIVGSVGIFLLQNDNFELFTCPEKGCEKASRQMLSGAVLVAAGFGAIAPSINLLTSGRRSLRLVRDLNGIGDFSNYRARPTPELTASPTGFTLNF